MLRVLLVCLLIQFCAPALAQGREQAERQFAAWLEQVIWPRARSAAVSRVTFDEALGGVALDWDLPGLERTGPQAPQQHFQAEFDAPGRYFAARTVEATTQAGRRMARRHAAVLARVERQTGVPGRIILAIWGRESAYGSVAIPHDAFAVLATKGFLDRRGDYFAGELVAALKIAEAGLAPPGAMKSSWAGAMGQPQFLPSSYLDHAADGDGDGRADIWRSDADTIASIGNFLARHGWVRGRDWGFEVTVPDSVSCTLEGPRRGRAIRDWEAMGIRRVSGRPFPAHERQGDGFLLMPAGRLGPAFIVTPNFYVLKDYNKSDLYALFVGHVGDRIQFGLGDFAGQWRTSGTLRRGDIAFIQRALRERGYAINRVDGLAGVATRRAIGEWQQATGRKASCFFEPAMRAALGG